MINTAYASRMVTISEFRKAPASQVETAGNALLVVNNNQAAFYCVSVEHYEELRKKADELSKLMAVNPDILGKD